MNLVKRKEINFLNESREVKLTMSYLSGIGKGGNPAELEFSSKQKYNIIYLSRSQALQIRDFLDAYLREG